MEMEIVFRFVIVIGRRLLSRVWRREGAED